MKKTQSELTEGLVKKKYSEEEQIMVSNYLKRIKKVPVKFKVLGTTENPKIKAVGKDELLRSAKVTESLGTPDKELQSFLINQAIQSFKGCFSSEGQDNDRLDVVCNNALAILQGIAPQDEVEGMLAVQMVGVHNLAMAAMSRAMITDQTFEGRQAGIDQATKMLRTFTLQMEALKRYRTGGQQRVIVEYVNVHEGGQAIVGNVTHGGGDNDGKR